MRRSGVDALIARLRERLVDPSARTDSGGLSSPLYPPIPESAVAKTEAELGFNLPLAFRRMYLEVADGGFGPGYGLLSAAPDDEPSLLSNYRTFREGEYPERLYPTGTWPEQLLPICDWGDAIWSCVDCSTPEGKIVTHDDVEGPTVTDRNVFTWLSAWADGSDLWSEMYEDREALILNPFTRQPVKTMVRGTAKGRPWKP